MRTCALITGITGQDGSYLAELLLQQGYEVHGTTRHSSSSIPNRLQHLGARIAVHEIDLSQPATPLDLLTQIRPREVYNLAAPSFVPDSWDQVSRMGDAIALGAVRWLEAIRQLDPTIRFYQASSSEMFGAARQTPQSETTPFEPRSPYGAAKAYAHHLTAQFRARHSMFACSGILFNHESPRRSDHFVTRKITQTAARIKLGLDRELRLGNLQAMRDWGFASDYVRAMWLMLQQDEPSDYVIGTGQTHSVEEFARIAFDHVGLDWRDYVVSDPGFFRASEGALLVADATQARTRLGWKPELDFPSLIRMMVDHDLMQIRSADRQRAA